MLDWLHRGTIHRTLDCRQGFDRELVKLQKPCPTDPAGLLENPICRMRVRG